MHTKECKHTQIVPVDILSSVCRDIIVDFTEISDGMSARFVTLDDFGEGMDDYDDYDDDVGDLSDSEDGKLYGSSEDDESVEDSDDDDDDDDIPDAKKDGTSKSKK